MKIIVITDACDGIGAEMARQLAETHRSSVALVLAARNEACGAHMPPCLI